MAGKATAVANGDELVRLIVALGAELGLDVRSQVRVGRRIWGAVRRIDIVLTQKETRRTLGIECKYQGVQGSAEEKIPSTIQDMTAWPIPGIVVFSGEGFSPNMAAFLLSTGKAIDLEDLKEWLVLYFGLPEASDSNAG